MFVRLEIKNFESHAHTIMDDFSPGFNLIRGPSNSGKSSILRAIRLVCFNEFSPDCVRLGSKFCEVHLTTDKGTVLVRRGDKMNQWEVTPNGQATKKFEKIGTELLEDVIEVTGLRPVKLGNVTFNANIMDQLEGHFMLAELDGQNASGSVRAQIIDEISGLSGIEGLIREVSLDNLRNGREAKRLEEEAKELATTMHDKPTLDAEENLLDRVDSLSQKAKDSSELAENMEVVVGRYGEADRAVQKARTALAGIPDVDRVVKDLKSAHAALQSCFVMEETMGKHENEAHEVTRVTKALSSLPDGESALVSLLSAQKKLSMATEFERLLETVDGLFVRICDIGHELGDIPDTKKVIDLITEAEESAKSASLMEEILKTCNRVSDSRDSAEEALALAIAGEKKANDEIAQILSEVDFCPFCSKPISDCDERHEAPVVLAAPVIPDPPVRKARKKI